MPTKNRRIATYLPKELDDRFKAFIVERNLTGESPALITILSEFFGVSQEVAHLSSSEFIALQERFEVLEERTSLMKSELLSTLREELLNSRSEFIEQVKINLRSELRSELQVRSLELQIPSEQLDLLVETGKQVEKGSSELPDDAKGELPKKISNVPHIDGTLKTGELASRLNVASSTVSHWRPTGKRGAKTPDELLRVTREKDPDGIGWIYLPDLKRFKPEKDIPGELPEVFKGELLGSDEF